MRARAPHAAGLALVASTVFALGASAARAAYPEQPVTLIVPSAAGGPTDVTARIVSEHMARTLGQQIVVENVAGAGGTAGILRAAAATPDGYTLMLGTMETLGVAPAVHPHLPYSPTRDFEPIGLVARAPILIVAGNDFPAKDLKAFVAHVKAKGPKLHEAHAGVGSVSHATCALLDSILGVQPTRVAYRGTGPALNDLVAGHVDYLCEQIVSLTPEIQRGTIKALAVASPERHPALPGVPTTREAGLPGFQVSAWTAIFAPRGMPKDVVARLGDALVTALDHPATRKRLTELGGDIPARQGRSPEALARLVQSEVTRWASVFKSMGGPTSRPLRGPAGRASTAAAADGG